MQGMTGAVKYVMQGMIVCELMHLADFIALPAY